MFSNQNLCSNQIPSEIAYFSHINKYHFLTLELHFTGVRDYIHCLHVLHFKSFLNVNGPLPKSLQNKITLLTDKPSTELMLQIESCHDYKGIMIKYVEYTKCTLSGKHGNTARILMTYVKLVDIYLRFSRACRTNDLELFIYSLGEMCTLFFTTSRPNYARWII